MGRELGKLLSHLQITFFTLSTGYRLISCLFQIKSFVDRLMDEDEVVDLHVWMDPEEFKSIIMDMRSRAFVKSRIEQILGWDASKYHSNKAFISGD